MKAELEKIKDELKNKFVSDLNTYKLLTVEEVFALAFDAAVKVLSEEENAKLREDVFNFKIRNSQLLEENANLKEELTYSKKLLNAAMEQINMRDITIVDLDKQVSDFRETLEIYADIERVTDQGIIANEVLAKHPQEEKE